jgi:hemolysin activation/secretion protein
VYGSYYRYVASEVGQGGADFKGEGYSAGGEGVWNFFQRRQLFLDLAGGVRWENIRVKNNLAGTTGREDFILPYIQLRLDRETESARTHGQIGLDFNVSSPETAQLVNLGRVDPDDSFGMLRGELTHSFYLDPMFNRDVQSSKPGGLVHEIQLAVKGQSSLGNRLIPNYQDTAGGLYTVRGYPESIVAGDDSFVATAEYRFHLPQALGPRPAPGELYGRPFRFRPQYDFGPTDWDLVFKGFFDAGIVRNTDPASFEFDSDLVGAGIGAELSITRRFNIRLDWGFALKDLTDSTGQTFVDAGHNELQFVLTLIY